MQDFTPFRIYKADESKNNGYEKGFFYGISMMAMSSLLLSCSSSEDVVDLGTTKQMVNMVSDPKPVQLTEAQRVFANDNNKFTQLPEDGERNR